MPQNMASLLSQPSQATPPETDPQQARQDQSQKGPQSLQNLIQENPGAGIEQGVNGQPAPNYHLTVAALKHMKMFEHGWEKLLKIDDIGKVDIKGSFIEMMAKLMGERIVSLPQTLQMMKGFPDNPLAQRQYVQEHYLRDKRAQEMLIAQHTMAFPNPNGVRPAELQPRGVDHVGMMHELGKHYKSFSRRNANA